MTWVHRLCSEFAGYLPWVRFTVHVLANDEAFLQYSGASSTCWLYSTCTAESTYLYSFLGFPGLKCRSLMHRPVLWDAEAVTWSHSYMFKVRPRLLAACVLQMTEVHIIHQLLSVRAIHFWSPRAICIRTKGIFLKNEKREIKMGSQKSKWREENV